MIQNFFAEKLPAFVSKFEIEHIQKGPFNNKVLKGMTILEFVSKQQRDSCLAAVKARNPFVSEGNGSRVDFSFALTRKQLSRNWALNQAQNLISRDLAEQAKAIEVQLQVGNDKSHRIVIVAGVTAFD